MSRILFDSFDSAGPTAWSILILDTLGLSDVVIRTGIYSRSVSATIGLTTALTRTGTFYRTINNIIGMTDVVSRSATFVRTVLNTIGLTSVFTALKPTIYPAILWRSFLAGDIRFSDFMSSLFRWGTTPAEAMEASESDSQLKWRPDLSKDITWRAD